MLVEAAQDFPFTPSFGIVPEYLAGRDTVLREMARAFQNGIGDPKLATVIIGARGLEKLRCSHAWEMRRALLDELGERDVGLVITVDDLDKVTIDEICEGCGIARRTFYNHFPDKYAVVVWIREVGGAGIFGQIGFSVTLREAVRSLVRATAEYGVFLRECYKTRIQPFEKR